MFAEDEYDSLIHETLRLLDAGTDVNQTAYVIAQAVAVGLLEVQGEENIRETVGKVMHLSMEFVTAVNSYLEDLESK